MKQVLLAGLCTAGLVCVSGCDRKKDAPAPAASNESAKTTPQPPRPDPAKPNRTIPPKTTPGQPRPAPPAPPAGKPVVDEARVLAELEKLPVGMTVVHTPARVKARKNDGKLEHIDKKWDYYWAYETKVTADAEPLEIIAFGSCEWIDGKWAMPQGTEEYDVIFGGPKEFAEWYKCPGARLDKGQSATDPQNWSGSKTVRAFKQRWYYIGKNKDGKRFKGEAVVELLPELDGAGKKDRETPGGEKPKPGSEQDG